MSEYIEMKAAYSFLPDRSLQGSFYRLEPLLPRQQVVKDPYRVTTWSKGLAAREAASSASPCRVSIITPSSRAFFLASSIFPSERSTSVTLRPTLGEVDRIPPRTSAKVQHTFSAEYTRQTRRSLYGTPRGSCSSCAYSPWNMAS